MDSLDKITAYVKTICNQMSFNKAKELVFEEMKNHVIDQRDHYINQGWKEDEATIQAITDTGDPVTIGEQFNHVHRPKPQWTMLISIGILLVSGLLIRTFFLQDTNEQWILMGDMTAVFISIIVMFTAYFLDFTLIAKYSKIIYPIVIIFVIVNLIYGVQINGRRCFISIVRTKESIVCLGLIFPLIYAAMLYRMRNRGYFGIILCGIVYFVPAFLILTIPSATIFVYFTMASLILTGTAIYKNWFETKKIYSYLLMVVPSAIIGIFYINPLKPYQVARLYNIFNVKDANYMVALTKEILKGAKFIGHGELPAEYTNHVFQLPNINTEYLLTYLIHNYGWITFVFILIIMLFFIIKGFSMCFKQKSFMGLFISLAVMLTFTMEMAGYIVYDLAMFNLTPISLPLVSYGNITLIINMALIGIMLSVFRTGDVVLDSKLNMVSKKIINFSDGTLTIKFKS